MNSNRQLNESVEVFAKANLEVACVEGTFVNNCVLGGANGLWTFENVGAEWIARKSLWIRSKMLATPVPGGWQIRLSSAHASRVATLFDVSFTSPLPMAASSFQPVGTTVASAIRYRGTVRLVTPIDVFGTESGSNPTDLTLSVDAALLPSCPGIGGSCLLLSDPSNTIARSGQLAIALDGADRRQQFLPSPKHDLQIDNNSYGSLVSSVRLDPNTEGPGMFSLKKHSSTGSIIASFKVDVGEASNTSASFADPLTIQGFFTGTPVSQNCSRDRDCPASWQCGSDGQCVGCLSSSDCGANESCNAGFCANNDLLRSGTALGTGPSAIRTDADDWAFALQSAMSKYLANQASAANDSVFSFGMIFSPNIGLYSATPKTLWSPPSSNFDWSVADTHNVGWFHRALSQIIGPIRGLPTYGSSAALWVQPSSAPFVPASRCTPTLSSTPGNTPCGVSTFFNQVSSVPGAMPCIDDRNLFSTSPAVITTLPTSTGVPLCSRLYAAMKSSPLAPDGIPANYFSYCTYTGTNMYIDDGVFLVDGHQIYNCPDWHWALTQEGSTACFATPRDSTPLASTPFTISDSQVMKYSGDLSCQLGGPYGANLTYHSDIATTRLSAKTLLRECLNDLGEVEAHDVLTGVSSLPSNDSSGGLTSDFADQYFTGNKCIQPGTFFNAFANGSWEYRSRLMQQWIEIHSFVASQYFEEYRLALTDAGASSLPESAPAATDIAPVEEVLDRLAYGWAFVIEKLAAFKYAPKDALRNPDYRVRAGFSPENLPQHEQPLGFIPGAIEGLTTYLKLVDAVLETEQFKNQAQVMETSVAPASLKDARRNAGEALRYALAVEGQLAAIYKHALSPELVNGTEVPATRPSLVDLSWYEPMMAATKLLGEVKSGLAFRATTNSDPIGLAAQDVPLFFGDLNGTNSRFFAASDYLLNTWATSAVGSAQQALEIARGSWMSRRNATIQDEDRKNDRLRTIEGIYTRYGEEIERICGLPASNGDPFTRLAEVTDDKIDSCFIRQKVDKTGYDVCEGAAECLENSGSLNCIKARCRSACMEKKNSTQINTCRTACNSLTKPPVTVHNLNQRPTEPITQISCTVLSSNSLTAYNRCLQERSAGAKDTHLARMKFFQLPTRRVLEQVKGHPLREQIDRVKKLSIAQIFAEGPNNYDVPRNYNTPSAEMNGQGRHFRDKAEVACKQFFSKSPSCIGAVSLDVYYTDGTSEFYQFEPGSERIENQYTDLYQRPCRAGDVIWESRTGDSLDFKEQVCGLTSCSAKTGTCRFPDPVRVVCLRDVYDEEVAIALAVDGVLDDSTVEQKAQKECEASSSEVSPTATVGPLPFPPECFGGELGAASIQRHGAIQDIGLARSQWQDAQEIYGIGGNFCATLESNEQTIQSAEADFIDEMHALGVAKAQLDGLARGLAGGSLQTFVSGAFTTASGLLQEAMSDRSLKHSALLRKISAQEKILSCFADLDKQSATFDTVQSVVERRITDYFAASQRLLTLKDQVRRNLANLRWAAKRESARPWSSYAHSYWYEEKAERYLREFRWAQRLVFLAMQAIEYEFQQSFNLRQEILAASHPDQLEQAIRAMQRDVATRAINRRRPEELSSVLSLRDDILGVRNRSDDNRPGERNLSPADRFQGRLWDKRYAVYDKNGEWIGQGVPFNMAPFATLRTRCAERVWRVTATVQGDGLSDREPGVPLKLLKKNSFGSQWCDGRGDGSLFQTGHIQPSRNLFKDQSQGGQAGEDEQFSAASIYPFFNVRRADFFKEQFQEGASEELAGRGLYGDYVLLFPREMLLGETLSSPSETQYGTIEDAKFPLERVEDVLLRFDYLSVDNFEGIAQVGN
jgi:hypothetical protein